VLGQLRATSGPNHEPRSPNIELIGYQSRETVVELPWAAGCCPCVEKLRTVLPLTVALRDGAVQLVSILAPSSQLEQSSVASLRRHCLYLPCRLIHVCVCVFVEWAHT
jgi:hypothetical protein